MSTPNGQSRQPKGIPTGGQFAASAHAEAAVTLDDDDEAQADAYMAFMEQGAPDPNDAYRDAYRGDCQRCGAAMVDDPAGSPGVLVHADDNGQPDYDADEDHAPVPEDAVPAIGFPGPVDDADRAADLAEAEATRVTDAENARNGAWEPGQQPDLDHLRHGGGPFDPETERCIECDGHFKHASDCVTLPENAVNPGTPMHAEHGNCADCGGRILLDPDTDGAVHLDEHGGYLKADHPARVPADQDLDTAANAAADAARMLAAITGDDVEPLTPETAYEANRRAAEDALAQHERGEQGMWNLAMAAVCLESNLREVDSDEARAAVARLETTRTGTPEEAAALSDAVRAAIETGDRQIRTFQGKTAAQWREEARGGRQRSADSFARSDTDGYLSQWASDTMARKYDACAELAEQGGHAEFRALLDMDGNLVRAKEVNTRYGAAWMLLDEDDQSTGEWVNLSQAKSAAKRNEAYAKKGYRMGTVRVPAAVGMSEGLQPYPYFFRTDGGFDPNAEVTSVGETEDWE